MGTNVSQRTPKKLEAQLLEVKKNFHGDMGISFRHYRTGDEIEINSDTTFPTASTIKLAILCAAFQEINEGKIKYYDTHVYSTTMRKEGAGFLRNYQDGTPIEFKEALHFMITVSDNVATNMVIDWLGGFDPINMWLTDHGFKVTRSLTYIGGGTKWNEELAKQWGIGVTTPHEMRHLMEMIRFNQAGTPANCDRMMRLLTHQYFDEDIASQIPPYVHIGSKSGALSASKSDVAVVDAPTGTYTLAVYTKNNKDQRWENDNEAENAIRKISRLIWEYYNPHSKWTQPPGAEKYW